MHIDALLDPAHLSEMITEGFLRTQPDQLLTIVKYTETAQYGQVWNATTRQCRGPVVHVDRSPGSGRGRGCPS